MNEYEFTFLALLLAFLLTIMTAGEPDLLDGLIYMTGVGR